MDLDRANSPLLMPHWLTQRARLSPRRLALAVGNRRWTYWDLAASVDRTARSLASLGVGPGDRVALLLRNGYPFVALVHGLTRLGAVLVPLNIRLAADELGWQITDVGARLLIHDEQHRDLAARVGEGWPEFRRVMVSFDPNQDDLTLAGDSPSAAPGDSALADRIDLSAVQSIIYTSGTTGRPKGALITYGNLWWSAVGSALNLGHHHDDRWLACLPLFHVGGLSILFRGAIYGIAAIVHETFEASAVNDAIDESGVTIVSVVSTMLQRMLEARGDRPYPSSLRCVLIGGGPVPPSLLQTAVARDVPVVQTYGLTETASQVATLAPEDALAKLGSAGKPLLPMELRIERDGASVPPGEIGEIVVRGPTVSPGYWRGDRRQESGDGGRGLGVGGWGTGDPGQESGRGETGEPGISAENLGGWLRTGDLGYLDDEGFLYVVDRRDDLIVSGGENVYPAEVEAVLREHPAVDEVGVIGVPDAEWGQAVAAAVKIRPGAQLTAEELVDFCRPRLARYKIPSQFRFVDALPRNATGKLLRRTLREEWRE